MEVVAAVAFTIGQLMLLGFLCYEGYRVVLYYYRKYTTQKKEEADSAGGGVSSGACTVRCTVLSSP